MVEHDVPACDLAFMPAPLSMTLGPLNRLVTIGFLEPRFRDELGLPWTDRYQRIFDGLTRVAAATNRRLRARCVSSR